MSPKECDRCVAVFVWSKYRQQLSGLQGWMAWICSSRSLGKHKQLGATNSAQGLESRSTACQSGAQPQTQVSSMSFEAQGLMGA